MYIPSFTELKRNLIRAYQRAIRGFDYSIRNGWGLEEYFSQIIPEIKVFCERDLKQQKEWDNYGPENPRTEIFETTLKLISDWEKMTYEDEMKNENQLTCLFEYISKHMGWYWD